MATPAYTRDSGVATFSSTSSFNIATTPDANGFLLLPITLTASRTVSVSDTGGGTWARLATFYSATAATQSDIWVSYGRANTAITITASWTGSTAGSYTLLEGTNATLDDASSTFDNPSGTTHHSASSGEIDTAADVCILFCARLNSGTTPTMPSGFTRIGASSSPNIFGYRFVAAAQSDERGSFTLAAARTSAAVIASVKAVAATSNNAGQLLLLGVGA